MKERLFECRSCGAQTDRCGLLFEPDCCADPQRYEMPLWMKFKPCCDNEDRNMNGGCNSCGDPCL